MDSKKLTYLTLVASLLFLGYAVHDARVKKDGDAGEPVLGTDLVTGKSVTASSLSRNWIPNETVTGNVLAAYFAQNRRDWSRANIFLDRLNGSGVTDAATAQRMMLLAISAGEFDRATDYANRLLKMGVPAPEDVPAGMVDTTADGRNLASLVLMAQSVRSGDLPAAEKNLSDVRSDALKSFVQPVIMGWLQAGQKKPTPDVAANPSLLQALHQGFSAEWVGAKDVSNRVFDTLSRAPLSPAGAMIVAAYNIRNGRAELARGVLAATLKDNPYDAEAKKILEALDQGQTPVLRPEYTYHLQGVTAGVALAFRDLAQMMMADEATDSALVFAQMGRLIRPDVPGLSMLVGNIFYGQKRYTEAAAAFQSVPAEDADYADAQIRLSEMRGDEGKPDEAIEILEALMKSKPSPRVAYGLGEVYRGSKDYAKAIKAYDQAVSLSGGAADDDMWSVYYVRAMAFDELDEWEKAEADLKKALEYRPGNPHVLNYLGYSWADRNINLPEARDMLMKALAKSPADPFITDSLGWVFFREGKLAEATQLLERAVSLKPYDPVLNDHLGDVYEKVGRTLEARYQWRRALDYADAEKDAKVIEAIRKKLADGKAPAD